jgi:hypothetical protein
VWSSMCCQLTQHTNQHYYIPLQQIRSLWSLFKLKYTHCNLVFAPTFVCMYVCTCVCMYKTQAFFHWIAPPLDVSLAWLIHLEDGDCNVCQNTVIASTNDVAKHWRPKSHNCVHLSSLHITYLLFTKNEMKNLQSL